MREDGESNRQPGAPVWATSSDRTGPAAALRQASPGRLAVVQEEEREVRVPGMEFQNEFVGEDQPEEMNASVPSSLREEVRKVSEANAAAINQPQIVTEESRKEEDAAPKAEVASFNRKLSTRRGSDKKKQEEEKGSFEAGIQPVADTKLDSLSPGQTNEQKESAVVLLESTKPPGTNP